MAEIQGFAERLSTLRRSRSISQDVLATVLGVSKSAVSKFEIGKGLPLPENLVKLSAYFGVSVDYLLTGGEFSPVEVDHFSPKSSIPFKAEEEQRPAYGKDVRVLTVQVDADNNENIELVSTRAAAGYVAGGFTEREFIGSLPSFSLPDPAYRNATFRAFQVAGDSMQSTLYDRDWVICRFVENWDKDIRDGYVHVVVADDSLLVKRLQNRLTERGELTLHSDNPAYPTQFLDGAAVREVWVGVARLSRQLVNPRYDVNNELMRTRADVDELLAFMQKMKGLPSKNTKRK